MDVYVDTVPWYKQPLVWMIIAIPMSAVIVCMVLLYLAVTTDDGLVADDYYKQGMTINRQIKRDISATTYKVVANIEIDNATGFVKVEFDKGNMKDYPPQLTFVLRHSAKQEYDQRIILHRGLDNVYVGSVIGGIQMGVWHLELSNLDDEAALQWRLVRRVSLENVTTILIKPE